MPPMKRRKSVKDGFLRLPDDLLEEVFFRLPPDEPAYLVYVSAVRKNWRRILADTGFRRRYREFHATPPVLGLFQEDTRFVRTSSLLPVLRDYRPRWVFAPVVLDCRHGRALFTNYRRYLSVFNPLTGHKPRVPFPDNDVRSFSAAVLCAAQGCDHDGCQRGHFRVATVTTDQDRRVTKGWLYSSENRTWSDLTSVHHPNVTNYAFNKHEPSVLVGDALYFNTHGVIKCNLGTLCLSLYPKPTDAKGRLMTAEHDGLGFAAVVDDTNLTLWSMETGLEGAMGWAKLRVIGIGMLLPDSALSNPTPEYTISGVVENTQVIFISMWYFYQSPDCYMVDLKSGRVKKVSFPGTKFYPYMRFYIPGITYAHMYNPEHSFSTICRWHLAA